MTEEVDQHPISAVQAAVLTPEQIAELVSRHTALECENADLRRQLAWFKRQIFGERSERRIIDDAIQGYLGQDFSALPDQQPANKKTRVAAHQRECKPKRPSEDAEDSRLFFDDKRVPVEVIVVPNPEVAGLDPEQFEVIGEKVSHRLAQRPGSYVILKYVRPLIKRRDTLALSCAPAPTGVIEGSRADVSFIAGMIDRKSVV